MRIVLYFKKNKDNANAGNNEELVEIEWSRESL